MNQEIEPLKYRANQFYAGAMIIKVATQEDLQKANSLRQAAKGLMDVIDDFFRPMHRKAKESVDEISANWKAHRAPVDNADMHLKLEMNSFVARVEKERVEALEKARLAAEAEAKRKADDDALLAAASKLEEEGKKEEAEKIIEEATKEVAIPVPPPLPPPPAPKAQGMAVRHDWKWRVVNEDLIPRPFLMLDGVKITRHVKEHKGETQIPGIEAYLEAGVVTKE
jgi:hypothetical protein